MDNLTTQFNPVLAPTGQQSGLTQHDLGLAGITAPGTPPETGPHVINAAELPQQTIIEAATPPGVLSYDITLGDEASEPSEGEGREPGSVTWAPAPRPVWFTGLGPHIPGGSRVRVGEAGSSGQYEPAS